MNRDVNTELEGNLSPGLMRIRAKSCKQFIYAAKMLSVNPNDAAQHSDRHAFGFIFSPQISAKAKKLRVVSKDDIIRTPLLVCLALLLLPLVRFLVVSEYQTMCVQIHQKYKEESGNS